MSTDTYIFSVGELSKKIVHGVEKQVYPVAAYDNIRMGVGLKPCGEDISNFFGPVSPRLVIASYRGMKIAELVREFGKGTLMACYFAGNRDEQIPSFFRDIAKTAENIIGKPARERILETVPEDVGSILENLNSHNILFDDSEIEDEIKRGTLKVTPKLQKYVDELERTRELHEKERYGRLVDPKDALTDVLNIPIVGKYTEILLDAYNQHVDQDTKIGIKYRGPNGFLNYIIAKSNTDPEIEIAIMGGLCDVGIGGFRDIGILELPKPALRIGLQYGGKDTEFQPKVPNAYSRILYKLHILKPDEPTENDKFPLLGREYGATIYPSGSFFDGEITMEVSDKRLTELAESISKTIAKGRLE